MFPRREQRADNHKRGCSLESGVYHRNKEDDLALFKDLQNKERERFLLHSNDDIDDILSAKSRNFSGYKLGESNDLLNAAEGDKNDYDWLITPPEPPLFSSLDDDDPPVNLARRGRPRSKSVSNSKSPSDYRNRRESASPHRPRPSPQTGNSTLQTRSRPVSATPPRMRHPSPEPSKLSDVQRSNTPQSRRMSAGSVVRGVSPMKARQGNSASPQLQAWQNNMPGVSSEAPPNLLTSLPDRSASHVKGSSPARRDRRSMSPAASRNVGSSHSSDRDSVSSRSRALTSSKKPTTNILSSSAPKKSSDFAIQQTDTKGPHNMFRPLLSSEPTHHISSSDQGTSGAHNTTEHEQNREEFTSDCVKGYYPGLDDKLFVMDQADAIHDDFEKKILKGSVGDRHTEIGDPSDMALDRKNVYADPKGTPNMVICSKCNVELSLKGLIKEGGPQSCQEYTSLEVNSTRTNIQTVIVGENTKMGIENGLVEVLNQPAPIQESIEKVADLSQHSYSDLSTTEMREDTKARILSLDEATEAILFCSSIVHNLAYEAANIAIDNETPQVQVSQPDITFISDERDIRSRNTSKCNPKTQKVEDKSLEIDTKPTSTNDENNKKLSSSIVEDPYKGDSFDPLKMEARCNCVIM